MFVRFLYYPVALPTPLWILFWVFWKQVAVHSPIHRVGSYILTPWGWSSYVNYLQFLCMNNLLSPFIYLVSRFYIPVWSREYLSYISYFNPNNSLLLKLFQPWPLGASSVASYIPLTYSFHYHFPPYVLALYTLSVFYFVLESSISPKIPCSVFWRGVRNQDLGARCLCFYCNVIASRLDGERKYVQGRYTYL